MHADHWRHQKPRMTSNPQQAGSQSVMLALALDTVCSSRGFSVAEYAGVFRQFALVRLVVQNKPCIASKNNSLFNFKRQLLECTSAFQWTFYDSTAFKSSSVTWYDMHVEPFCVFRVLFPCTWMPSFLGPVADTVQHGQWHVELACWSRKRQCGINY